MSATDVTAAEATGAAEAAVEAITSAAGKDVTFSMALTQDQKDIRDWVHGFAADVMRPAAHEWDEKEKTPWPIIEEAAKIGLYGFEGLAQFFADPSGLTLPIVNEELFWGDAGMGMAIMGTSLAVAAIFGIGPGPWAFTLPLALAYSEREGMLAAGDRVLLGAFGAGFTWGSMVVRF